jgi:hypothetical protein
MKKVKGKKRKLKKGKAGKIGAPPAAKQDMSGQS